MLTRREFLKLCTSTLGYYSLSSVLPPVLSRAFAQGKVTRPPLIWLELGTCTGNSISLDNASDPDFRYFVTQMVDYRYHWLFTAAQGTTALQALRSTIENKRGEYILVVEGSAVTAQHGHFNYVAFEDNQPIPGTRVLKMLSEGAKHIVAVGSCATWGGPSAARPNPSRSIGIQKYLDRKVINVPGCPAHPDWIIGTIGHLILFGVPELDNMNRPTMFFGQTIHDLCERRAHFDNGEFAEYLGQDGCLYKVGCKGPVTLADCPRRQWNNHVNWPVKANTPCIGCVNPGFPDASMPFLSPLPDIKLPNIKINAATIGLAAGTVTALGVGGHAMASVLTGRMGKNLLRGTVPKKDVFRQNDLAKQIDDLRTGQRKILRKLGTLTGSPSTGVLDKLRSIFKQRND